MNTENQPKINRVSSDLTPVFFLALAVCIPFGKVILSGQSLFGSDFLLQFYPWKKFLYDAVSAEGSLPFWNPYLFSGTPFIANIQASMFYPLGLLYYLLPTDMAYLYTTILHCVIGAVFMYAFLRSLKCSRAGSFLSGFVFIFNGYFMAHLYAGHLSFVQNYVWIPLILLLGKKFMEGRGLKYAISGGMVLGAQILGGFPQIAFYTIFCVLFLCLYHTCLGFSARGSSYVLTMWSGTALLFIIGFLISALQLLPTYEFIELSTRAGGVDYSFATMDSLPPRNLLTFLFPMLFGSPVDGTYWISSTTWEFWEFCGYVGIATVVVVCLAARRLLLDRMGLFFLLLILTSLFLSFGKYNPFYPLIYRLPGFHNFRIPAQILFLFVFSMAVLSGKALDIVRNQNLFRKRARGTFMVILALVLPLVIWSCAFPGEFCGFISTHIQSVREGAKPVPLIGYVVSHTLLVSCSIFLAALILLYLHHRKSVSSSMFAAAFICLAMLDLGSFSFPMIRGFDLQRLLKKGETLAPLVDSSRISRSAVAGRCIIANAGLWYGFQDIQGYDPMILRRYVEYVNKSQGLPPDNAVVNLHYIRDFNSRLIRMLNLEYVVLCQAGRLGKTEPFIPRCLVVHRMIMKNGNEILDFMMGPGFDPRKTVVFETGQAPVDFSPGEPVKAGTDTCKIIRYQNDEISMISNLSAPGFLVMSEINYPGWEVYVDGERMEIFTGNYLFRTVPLGKGHREVRFMFNPSSFWIGVLVSVISLLGAVVLLVLSRRKGGLP